MLGAICHFAYWEAGLRDYVNKSVGLFDKENNEKWQIKYKGSNKSIIPDNIQFLLEKDGRHTSQ